MRKILLGIGLLVALLAQSCVDQPMFPDEPSIYLEDLTFIDVDGGFDTLRLRIHFTDGNGDLGLSDTDINPPYQNKIYPTYQVAGVSRFIRFNDHDSLPPFSWPYECLHWDTQAEINGIDYSGDTLYFQLNPNHYNISVRFYYKPNGQRQWELFDWRAFRVNECGETFDSRFPRLSESDREIPLEGSLTYDMPSSGFLPIFGLDTMRLDVVIRDRALNESNLISTPAFTLQGIQKGN